MIKIDKKELFELHDKYCTGHSCSGCPTKGLQGCSNHLVTYLIEQNPDLITDLPQNTEQIPLPVKTTWSLKPEYLPLYKSITGHTPDSVMSDIPDEIKPFYNAKTEPDYSKVPVGAVIEINLGADSYFGIVKENDRNKITIGYTLCTDVIDRSKNNLFFYYSKIKSLTILKLPEGK